MMSLFCRNVPYKKLLLPKDQNREQGNVPSDVSICHPQPKLLGLIALIAELHLEQQLLERTVFDAPPLSSYKKIEIILRYQIF